MKRRNEPQRIVRYLEGEELARRVPCWVGHGREAVEPCRAPSTVAVYGLHFCPRHGAEAANGAVMEMYQDAAERLEHATAPYAPDLNPALMAFYLEGRDRLYAIAREAESEEDEVLTSAFPFRADRVSPEVAGGIADPEITCEPETDSWRDNRRSIHAAMRHAFTTERASFYVEDMEPQRETRAEQLAYAIALSRGDHPEVLELAHAANVDAARTLYGMLQD